MASRRGFLSSVLRTAWAGGAVMDQALLRAVRARAQSNYELPVLFDMERVADGVYAAIAKPQSLLNSNAVIVENAEDLMIVDTHSKPSAVASLVRQLRDSVSKKPVRYVVASHFHWDHSQGLPAYRRLAPRADFISSDATRRLVSEQTVPRLKASFEDLRRAADVYKKSAAETKSAAQKTAFETMRRETLDYLHEMEQFTPELPNVTLSRDLVIHDKAHDLHLAFRGRGHTAGDVIVHIPSKKTVITGDLAHGFFPFLGDAYPLEWPRTLLSVAEFEFTNIAGGHGAVFRSRDRLYQMGNYIEEVTDQVARRRQRGMPLAAIAPEITPDKLRTFADGGFGAASAEAIIRYRRLAPPAPSVVDVAADAVKSNVEQIYNALERG
ncbi:MAG: MBL fold metallo-hydrolase [Bryobacteraceae bacterium]